MGVEEKRTENGEMYYLATCEWPNKKGHWTWESYTFSPSDSRTRKREYTRAREIYSDHVDTHSSDD